jgi:hypothetical protein
VVGIGEAPDGASIACSAEEAGGGAFGEELANGHWGEAETLCGGAAADIGMAFAVTKDGPSGGRDVILGWDGRAPTLSVTRDRWITGGD